MDDNRVWLKLVCPELPMVCSEAVAMPGKSQ
jgi:hypothetical protein